MAAAESAPPQRILLATDLTSRCDRALDRASQLAGEWGAELVAAHVADPARIALPESDRSRRLTRRLRDPLERMRWRIRRDLAGTADHVRLVLEGGEPSAKLIEIAAREECDLIVTGAPSSESLERIILGSNITRLVRGATAPVLMVHDRGARPYHRIAVATDFSDASFHALLRTAALFPSSSISLFHAYDIPYSGFLSDGDFARELQAMEEKACARVLDDMRIGPLLRKRITVEIEHGPLDARLDDFIEDQHIDLTVIGSHGHGAMFDALVGSTGKRLVETLERDLLIIRYREGTG